VKVLIPFWDMGIFPRYIPQFKAIAEHCKEFNVAYMWGEPSPGWPSCFTFHKVKLRQSGNGSINWLTSREHVASQLSGVDFDLVYTLSGRWMQHYATHIAESRGVPQVIRLRGDPETVDGIVTPGRLKRIALDYIYRSSFTKAALVIPIADKMVHVARHYGVRRISETIPNGIDIDKFKPTDMPPMYHAIYIGRVSPEKGSDFLLKLMHMTPEITYGVVGPIQCDWDPPGNCKTIGPVPYSEVQEIYNHANIVLLPSRTEGCPNALLEAYASGRPVLGTPDAIPKEFEVYGLRVAADAETWAELLRRIKWFNLADLGRQARRYVVRFTWQEYGRRMAEALQSVLSEELVKPVEDEVPAIERS